VHDVVQFGPVRCQPVDAKTRAKTGLNELLRNAL
jgi:hypothetical protein